MADPTSIVLYHSPGSRSGRTKMLLDLLELDYQTVIVDISKNENKDPSYLAINPYGVVPTLVHNDRVVFESAAQMMYLADLYSERGLAPALDDPCRATYVELFVLSPSEMERQVMGAWRNPDDPTSEKTIHGVLDLWEHRLVGPCFLGERMSALDVFLHWGLRFFSDEHLKGHERIVGYRDHMNERIDWSGY
ncbi:MAG: glutathione S-transferase [Myxococcota bacterium]